MADSPSGTFHDGTPLAARTGPMAAEKPHTSEVLNSLIDEAIRDIMDLELAALGDHCLSMQLRPILSTALSAAFKQGRIVQSR